jgi:hypothetical protein
MKSNHNDPKTNKSLAIRTVRSKKRNAKAAEVVAAVKSAYGHKVTPTQIYVVKSKANVRGARRAAQARGRTDIHALGAPADWVRAIKAARQLLKVTGSAENAVAILRAVEA